jgi:hypothetical protein
VLILTTQQISQSNTVISQKGIIPIWLEVAKDKNRKIATEKLCLKMHLPVVWL